MRNSAFGQGGIGRVRSRVATGLGILVAAALSSALLASPACAATPPRTPNILMIVVDDVGVTDIGAYGGEIDTPNLDALAASGAKLTNFHVSPTCSPTRVMLMTGVDHHPAGVGNMAELLTPEQKGKPGYEGRMNDQVATIAEILRGAGYRTVLSGKWHLGIAKGLWPADRGFDRSISLLHGTENYFGEPDARHDDVNYVEDHALIQRPRGVYSTDLWTDNLIKMLKEGRDQKRPFYAYLAYPAAHYPLMAPPELIAKYRGRYDLGYEKLRQDRLARQRALGLLGDVPLHGPIGVKPWADLTPAERAYEARKMEIYAAMIDSIDSNIGRVVSYLKETGEFENTIIMFTSDNGPAGSAYESVGVFDKGFADFIAKNFDNSLENLGKPTSQIWYGPGWGQAASAPSLLWKIFTSEGGLRSPLIVAGPGVKAGVVSGALTTATDIVPTQLAAAGVAPATTMNGKPVRKIDGLSLIPVLSGRSSGVRGPNDVVGEELFGGRALYKGDYKALYLTDLAENVDPSLKAGEWQLYNLKRDPGETTNLAKAEPARLKELVGDWEAYAARNGVILPSKGVVAIDAKERREDASKR